MFITKKCGDLVEVTFASWGEGPKKLKFRRSSISMIHLYKFQGIFFAFQVPPDLISLEQTTETNPDVRISQEEEDSR